MKLYRNWIINEVARAMTKGEHTNERTSERMYVRTYVRDRPYIPSTTLLCEGVITLVELSYTMLHTKFQDHRFIGSGEEDFLKFLPYVGMAAMLVM